MRSSILSGYKTKMFAEYFQFLNSPSLSIDEERGVRRDVLFQSTPMVDDERSSSPLTTPNPPPLHSHHHLGHSTPNKAKRSLAPKTPTPFKNAMAELEKQGGVVKCLSVS